MIKISREIYGRTVRVSGELGETQSQLDHFEAHVENIIHRIPEPCRAGAFNKAWEDGHAYGFDEVLAHLEELAEIFKPLMKTNARTPTTTPAHTADY